MQLGMCQASLLAARLRANTFSEVRTVLIAAWTNHVKCSAERRIDSSWVRTHALSQLRLMPAPWTTRPNCLGNAETAKTHIVPMHFGSSCAAPCPDGRLPSVSAQVGGAGLRAAAAATLASAAATLRRRAHVQRPRELLQHDPIGTKRSPSLLRVRAR